MYLKNLLNITGKSPDKKSDTENVILSSSLKDVCSKKGSRHIIAAFLLLTFPLAGCESPGSVGGGLGQGGGEVEIMVYEQENFSVIESNTISGRLQNSAMGVFDDPLYGNIRSMSLLKPAITNSSVDSLEADDVITLRLVFNSEVYGNPNSISRYEIYEAGEMWRGNELRYSNEIAINMAEKVGEFEVGAVDSTGLEVELSPAWIEKFASFYNAPSAERDSLYRKTFPGLVIVPASTNEVIHFLKHGFETDDEDEIITSFLIHLAEEEGNGDSDPDEEEGGPVELSLSDWGTSMVRTSEPDPSHGYVLHNTERVVRFELDYPLEALKSENIINAQLVFSLDNSNMFPEIDRPEPQSIRGYVFAKEPTDIASEIFISDPRFAAPLTEDENIYNLNITQYVINEVYGNVEEGPLYVTLHAINGLFYSAQFFDNQGPANRKPRLVITSAK